MRLILSAEPDFDVASLEDVWLLFTSSGSFSSAPYLARGYTKLDAYIVGGGGPGGYGRSTTNGSFAGGGGGGGGSGGLNQFNDRYLAAYDGSQAFTIGEGGIADVAGASRPGGTTIFDDLKAYGGGSGGLGSFGTDTTNGYGGGGGGGAGSGGPGIHGGNGTGAGANGGASGPNTLPYVYASDGHGGKGAGTSGNEATAGHNFSNSGDNNELAIGGGGGGGGGHATRTESAGGAVAGTGIGGQAWGPYNVIGVGIETVGGGGGGGAGGHDLRPYTPFSQLHGQKEPLVVRNGVSRRLIGVGAGGHGGAGSRSIVDPSDITLRPDNGYSGLIVLRIHT